MRYFLDTYALIEIIKGNEKFKMFLESDLFTSIFNLYELYFALLRDFDEQTAKKFFYDFKKIVLPINDPHIFNAAKFKLENKKIFSYADCLDYMMAVDYNLKFLTGDKEFENIENVEFLQK